MDKEVDATVVVANEVAAVVNRSTEISKGKFAFSISDYEAKKKYNLDGHVLQWH